MYANVTCGSTFLFVVAFTQIYDYSNVKTEWGSRMPQLDEHTEGPHKIWITLHPIKKAIIQYYQCVWTQPRCLAFAHLSV